MKQRDNLATVNRKKIDELKLKSQKKKNTESDK